MRVDVDGEVHSIVERHGDVLEGTRRDWVVEREVAFGIGIITRVGNNYSLREEEICVRKTAVRSSQAEVS